MVTTKANKTPAAIQGNAPYARLYRTARRRLRKPGTVLGLAILLLLLAAALLAPVIERHPPRTIHYTSLQTPPDATFWFGTDDLGRSVFSRVLHGIRTSLKIGFSAVGLALLGGLPLGLLAGYFGGTLDRVIVRFLEINLAFPSILLAIAVVAVLGPGTTNTIYALAISTLPIYALTVRSTARTLINLDYVQAARALGSGHIRNIWKHILPGVISPLLIISTVNIGGAVLAAAGLGYLGLGAQPPTPELGTMLSEARAHLRSAWWMSVFPGLAITLIVLSLNLVGDALRDILDQRSNSS
jgi:peptide/nickel transport system permease protein